MKKLKAWLALKLRAPKPRLAIGVGPCTLASVKSLAIVEQACRNAVPDIPIIYGGPLASIVGLEWFFFEHLHAYAVIPGDGEIVLSDLLAALKCGKRSEVKGASYGPSHQFVPNLVKNLDMIPFPARDLFDNSLYFPSTRRDLFVSPCASVVCSRGCPYNCGFCCSSVIRTGCQSKRSLVNIGAEIQVLAEEMGVRSIVFYDDCAFSNQTSLNEDVVRFSDMIKRVGKGAVWQIEMRPDVANQLNEDSIKAFFEGGCRQINLGIEKGTLRALLSIDKCLLPEQTMEACKRIRLAAPGLRIAGTFIIGGPSETYEEAMETVRFSMGLELTFAHFYPLEIYPGTRLYQKKFGADMRVWLDRVLQESVFTGSLVYEDILGKETLAELICKAYRTFYRREEWVRLAQQLLGTRFSNVLPIVTAWGENPRW
jgi:anaerobic magnesium-protoporphyrin IX monomethyl ester cyclase